MQQYCIASQHTDIGNGNVQAYTLDATYYGYTVQTLLQLTVVVLIFALNTLSEHKFFSTTKHHVLVPLLLNHGHMHKTMLPALPPSQLTCSLSRNPRISRQSG